MSGVGEALAIVSCVAGLIQAYDAGSRIVKQIKARRQAHDALPPSDLLEESIENGKREIERVVAFGTERFGPSFEEGDTAAQLALYKITIVTQNALLAGLTQARDDDGVIDFDTCIDASDKGRVDALIALNALFQRKLDEDMDKKKNSLPTENQQQQVLLQQLNVPPPAAVPAAPAHQATEPGAKSQQTPPPTPPLGKVKKSRTFGFRRKESNPQTAAPTTTQTISRPDPSPRSSQQDMVPRSPRRNTDASTSSSATWSSSGSRNSTAGYDNVNLGAPGTISQPDTGFSSMAGVSRHNTSLSTMSNMSTASTIAPITKYGGFCKNAYELREGSVKKALRLGPVGVYGRNLAYKCSSSKCMFSGQALHDKKGHRVDDKIYMAPSGLQYRWMFLAKSHTQQAEAFDPSFRCLVCLMLGDESEDFHGHGALLAHILSHQGAYVGGAQLGGPVAFTNQGVKTDMTDGFDLRFPPVDQHRVPQPITGRRVPDGLNHGGMVSLKVQDVVSDKSPTVFAYEADANPWA